MADQIVVHFGSEKKRKLTATVTPAGRFRGVLRLSPAQRKTLSEAFNLRVLKGPPVPGVTVAERNTEVELTTTDPGPGVCYWIGTDLVCW